MPKLPNYLERSRRDVDAFSNLVELRRRSVAQESRTLAKMNSRSFVQRNLLRVSTTHARATPPNTRALPVFNTHAMPPRCSYPDAA